MAIFRQLRFSKARDLGPATRPVRQLCGLMAATNRARLRIGLRTTLQATDSGRARALDHVTNRQAVLSYRVQETDSFERSRMKETIMKSVVIGGTGLIGSKLVNKLREQGHEAVAAAPNTGVNTFTGEGLAKVLKGASVVVDVSNSPSWEDAAVLKFFETSTRNLLTSGAAAGVRHHVALSVVGSDRLSESGYIRAKIAQEKLIRASSIPYSIV